MNLRQWFRFAGMILLILTVVSGLAFAAPKTEADKFTGEVLVFDIKKFGLKIGAGELAYKGLVEKEAARCVLVVFTSRALNFYDEEKIFLDPQTFLPRVVERDLNVFGSKEKITEIYDTAQGIVRIKKNSGGKITDQTIQQPTTLENIYGFIYRFRLRGTFQTGERIKLNLPTKTVVIEVMKKTQVTAAGQEQTAYFLQTQPAQYDLWFDTSERKIPLRIDGAVGLKKAVLVLRSAAR
ncbi:MAG: DUF3108 domain-containing protein [Candidatus Omnitrophica bacterium]|nr:DUF3108 domain-containing protein [Candidatus Omnitrophota bacterium]